MTRPPHRKRYGWFRLYNDFCTHPKWARIAIGSGVKKRRVILIALWILTSGNKGSPRGSLDAFDLLECAALFDIPPQEVRRVYKCLEKTGWIEQEYLSTWDERQPDKEDQTTVIRSKRYRARKKEQLREALNDERHAVTSVTSRPDTDKKVRGTTETEFAAGTIVTADELAMATQRPLPLPFGVVRNKR
jgi:hypothetical protein